jgi:hypothetical protein
MIQPQHPQLSPLGDEATSRLVALAGAFMDNNEAQTQTFIEMVLALLEDRFSWLGKDEPASGAETVDQLSDCCRSSRQL